MRMQVGVMAIAIGVSAAVPVLAQAPSTVQLPSFSSFGASTTVSAPDRGRASLGGVGRSSSGSTAFGPSLGPSSRSFGRQTSATNVDVQTRIHDLNAMDQQVLEQAAKNRNSAGRKSSPQSMGAYSSSTSSADQPPPGSVAEARRQHAAEVESQQRQAADYARQAKKAAARGKPQVAKVLYQMAERRAKGELKAEIRKELAALKSPPKPEEITRRNTGISP